MKFCESGAVLAVNMGVFVSNMQDSIEAHIQASLKMARILMEDRSQRILAASLGMKLLARRFQERSFTTMSFREPISQHSPTCQVCRPLHVVRSSTAVSLPLDTGSNRAETTGG